MNLSEYLASKHSRSKALSFKEAKILGLKWPLRRGWPQRFGKMSISDETLATLKATRKDHKKAAVSTTSIGSLADEIAERAMVLHGLCIAENFAPDPVGDQAERPRLITRSKAFATSAGFLASYEWRAVRMQVLKRDGATCACCGASPATGAVMHVDHIKPRRTHPHLALDAGNLQVLCGACNHGKGNWDTTDWRGAHGRQNP